MEGAEDGKDGGQEEEGKKVRDSEAEVFERFIFNVEEKGSFVNLEAPWFLEWPGCQKGCCYSSSYIDSASSSCNAFWSAHICKTCMRQSCCTSSISAAW